MTEYTLEYMRLDEFISRFHPDNPKDHDIGSLITSFDEYGTFAEVPTIDENSGLVAAGHGRGLALNDKMRYKQPPPDGIVIDDDGMWKLPVVRGIKFKSETHLKNWLVTSNRLVETGGWLEPKLLKILNESANESMSLLRASGYDEDDVMRLAKQLNEPLDLSWLSEGHPEEKGNKKERAKYRYMTMFDYMRINWNDTKSWNSPARYFGGALVPVETDENGDIVYYYNEPFINDAVRIEDVRELIEVQTKQQARRDDGADLGHVAYPILFCVETVEAAIQTANILNESRLVAEFFIPDHIFEAAEDHLLGHNVNCVGSSEDLRQEAYNLAHSNDYGLIWIGFGNIAWFSRDGEKINARAALSGFEGVSAVFQTGPGSIDLVHTNELQGITE